MAEPRSPPRRPVGRSVRQAFVTGLAVVVPAVGTVLLFAFVLDWLYRALDRFSSMLPGEIASSIPLVGTELPVELAVPVALVALVLWVGFVVEGSRYGKLAVDHVDTLVTAVPGVGPVYESFRRMSDVVLDDDTENFREVKLVEFPARDVYTLGFLTASTPDALCEPTDHDAMQTLFLPMAPNPVMGGHLVHVPQSRVYDVDMTVEEGVRTVLTSGVGVAGSDAAATDPADDLAPDRHGDLGRVDGPERGFDAADGGEADSADAAGDGRAAGDGSPSAAEAATPAELAERARERGENR